MFECGMIVKEEDQSVLYQRVREQILAEEKNSNEQIDIMKWVASTFDRKY